MPAHPLRRSWVVGTDSSPQTPPAGPALRVLLLPGWRPRGSLGDIASEASLAATAPHSGSFKSEKLAPPLPQPCSRSHGASGLPEGPSVPLLDPSACPSLPPSFLHTGWTPHHNLQTANLTPQTRWSSQDLRTAPEATGLSWEGAAPIGRHSAHAGGGAWASPRPLQNSSGWGAGCSGWGPTLRLSMFCLPGTLPLRAVFLGNHRRPGEWATGAPASTRLMKEHLPTPSHSSPGSRSTHSLPLADEEPYCRVSYTNHPPPFSVWIFLSFFFKDTVT